MAFDLKCDWCHRVMQTLSTTEFLAMRDGGPSDDNETVCNVCKKNLDAAKGRITKIEMSVASEIRTIGEVAKKKVEEAMRNQGK